MDLRLDSVRGHVRPLETLRTAMRRDAVAHAYLFWGPAGVGKATVAMRIGAALLCDRRGEPGGPVDQACGDCPSCRKVMGGQHPDLRILEPEGAARLIKIDPVRTVSRAVAYPPILGRYKVVLIPEADRFNDAAGNALLKTLEEPSGQTIFLLGTSRRHLVLTTIQSRCQKLQFTALDRGVLAEWMSGEHGVEPAVADTVAGLADGRPGRALELLDDEFLALRAGWFERAAKITEPHPHELLSQAAELGSSRAALEPVLDLLRLYFRDVMVKASGAGPDAIAGRDQLELLERGRVTYGAGGALRALEAIEEGQRSLHFNTNAKLVGEFVLLSLRRAASRHAALGDDAPAPPRLRTGR